MGDERGPCGTVLHPVSGGQGGRRARCLPEVTDVAALDTRKSKAIDPAEMVEWMNTLKETGFDIRGTVRPPMREPQSWPVHLPRR
uniref:Multifunctional conjugation protein TraI n=1 Tax=Klebsiella pneumoniae TaxID=573 RepID=A0A2P1BNW7_KLEPN|nr:Multifunctional conjugation protein TraI [Klebsiella pneumoniae]